MGIYFLIKTNNLRRRGHFFCIEKIYLGVILENVKQNQIDMHQCMSFATLFIHG